MFMLPEVRRRAIMIESIPAAERRAVQLVSPSSARSVAILGIDLMTNSFSLSWSRSGQSLSFSMPIDAVRHVWRTVSGEWRIAVHEYVLDAEGNVTIG